MPSNLVVLAWEKFAPYFTTQVASNTHADFGLNVHVIVAVPNGAIIPSVGSAMNGSSQSIPYGVCSSLLTLEIKHLVCIQVILNKGKKIVAFVHYLKRNTIPKRFNGLGLFLTLTNMICILYSINMCTMQGENWYI